MAGDVRYLSPSSPSYPVTTRIFVVDDDKHYARLLSYRLDKPKDQDANAQAVHNLLSVFR